MNQFEMVAIIVAVVVLAGVLKHAVGPLNETLKEHLKDNRSGKNGESGSDDERLKSIEKRLQVLERIVTSDGYDLRQQFKDLDKDQ